MSDQEQRTAHMLEQSEAGLVRASETLRHAHEAMNAALMSESLAARHRQMARRYFGGSILALALALAVSRR